MQTENTETDPGVEEALTKTLPERFPCMVNSEGACCACTGNLVFALERLNRQGLLSKRVRILSGHLSKLPDEKGTFTVAVGNCVSKQTGADCRINACPHSTGRIYQTLLTALKNRIKSYSSASLSPSM